MKTASWLTFVLAVLLLTACGSVADPLSPSAEVIASGQTAFDLPNPGVAFLPPVGPGIDTTDFYGGASLEIRFKALDGSAPGSYLPPHYSSADGTVRVEDGAYHALWRVRTTAAAAGTPSLVRVEVWADDLAGTELGEACFGESGVKTTGDACFVASFDAMIRPNRSVKSGDGVLDVTGAQTLPIRVFIQGAGFRPENLSDLTPLSSEVTFDDIGPNCTVNEFNMPGQGVNALGAGVNALGAGVNALGAGVNALGAVGGLFLFGPGETDGAPSLRLLEAAEAGALAEGLVLDQLGSSLVRNAAILVVDDFGAGPAFRLDPALLDPDPSLDIDGLRALVESDGFSHGALVMHQIVEMVAAAGFEEAAGLAWIDASFRVFVRRNSDGSDDVHLVVAAVNIVDRDTSEIADLIRYALNGLRFYGFLEDAGMNGLDIRQAVLNMSFVIVPCSVLEDFDASGLETFEAYRDALAAENGVADDFHEALADLLLEPLDVANEPLLGAIECLIQDEGASIDDQYYPPENVYYQADWQYVLWGDYDAPTWDCAESGRSTVYVASSGNFGFDYAMYPAAWPEVLSVSSQDAVGETPADGFSSTTSSFSNAGEVMAPGSLYLLAASSGMDPTSGIPARLLGYAGTSFAAPVSSLFTALDLMDDEPRCTGPWSSHLSGEDDDANTALPAAAAAWCSAP